MNEPRLADTNHEWWFEQGNAECLAAAECINRLNQAFVDTVRASGGHNATRYLMVPGYDAAPANTIPDIYRLPTDSADQPTHTGVGCHFLLQGIFLTQGSNPGLLHCRQILYCLSYQGSPKQFLL